MKKIIVVLIVFCNILFLNNGCETSSSNQTEIDSINKKLDNLSTEVTALKNTKPDTVYSHTTMHSSDTVYSFSQHFEYSMPDTLWLKNIKTGEINQYVAADKFCPEMTELFENFDYDSVKAVGGLIVYYTSLDSCTINWTHNGKDIAGSWENELMFHIAYEYPGGSETFGFTDWYEIENKSIQCSLRVALPKGLIRPAIRASDRAGNWSIFWVSTIKENDILGWYIVNKL